MCGESSKVCRSGFSAFVANPQRNFPIFVAGNQQSAAGKLDRRKTKHTHSTPTSNFPTFSYTFFFFLFAFFCARPEKIRFSYVAGKHRQTHTSRGKCWLTSIHLVSDLCELFSAVMCFSRCRREIGNGFGPVIKQ